MHRKNARRQARLERAQGRQTTRMFGVENRTGARTAAYNSGIDPRGWISDSVGHVSDAVENIYGQPQSPISGPKMGGEKKGVNQDSTSSAVLPLAAGLAALLFMK